MPKTRIDDILALQAAELAKLEAQQAAEVLRAYEDARRSLHERLRTITDATPETQQRLRVMLAQAEQGTVELKQRLGQALAKGELKAHKTSMKHLLGLIKAQEPNFLDAGGAVEIEMVKRLAALRGLALHQFSVDRYGAQIVDDVQRALVAGVVEGLTVPQLAERIAGAAPGSVLASHRGRAELVARMELSRAYNDAHLESIRVANEKDPRPEDPLLKKIDEVFDHRNHPFSRAAHGTTARHDEPFKVAIAAVNAAAAAIGKKSSGVVWPSIDGFYVGMNLPAHFRERGRIIPWRASWGGVQPTPGPTPAPEPPAPPAPAPRPPEPAPAPPAPVPPLLPPLPGVPGVPPAALPAGEIELEIARRVVSVLADMDRGLLFDDVTRKLAEKALKALGMRVDLDEGAVVLKRPGLPKVNLDPNELGGLTHEPLNPLGWSEDATKYHKLAVRRLIELRQKALKAAGRNADDARNVERVFGDAFRGLLTKHVEPRPGARVTFDPQVHKGDASLQAGELVRVVRGDAWVLRGGQPNELVIGSIEVEAIPVAPPAPPSAPDRPVAAPGTPRYAPVLDETWTADLDAAGAHGKALYLADDTVFDRGELIVMGIDDPLGPGLGRTLIEGYLTPEGLALLPAELQAAPAAAGLDLTPAAAGRFLGPGWELASNTKVVGTSGPFYTLDVTKHLGYLAKGERLLFLHADGASRGMLTGYRVAAKVGLEPLELTVGLVQKNNRLGKSLKAAGATAGPGGGYEGTFLRTPPGAKPLSGRRYDELAAIERASVQQHFLFDWVTGTAQASGDDLLAFTDKGPRIVAFNKHRPVEIRSEAKFWDHATSGYFADEVRAAARAGNVSAIVDPDIVQAVSNWIGDLKDAPSAQFREMVAKLRPELSGQALDDAVQSVLWRRDRLLEDYRRLIATVSQEGGYGGPPTPTVAEPKAAAYRSPILELPPTATPGPRVVLGDEELITTRISSTFDATPEWMSYGVRAERLPPPPSAPALDALRLVDDRLPGGSPKAVLKDADGATWLFKSYGGDYRALADEAAGSIQRLAGRPSADVYAVKLPAGHPAVVERRLQAEGSLQKLFTDIDRPIKGMDLPDLPDAARLDVQREHVLDWLFSNHDGHSDNLLLTKGGRVVGIDKGQSFKFIGQDRFAWDYSPNADAGFETPFMNAQAEKYINGRLPAGSLVGPDHNPELARFIRQVQSIPDEELAAAVRPYFRARAAANKLPMGEEAAVQEVLRRKRSLYADTRRWYERVHADRKARGFDVPEPGQVVTDGVPARVSVVGQVPRSANPRYQVDDYNPSGGPIAREGRVRIVIEKPASQIKPTDIRAALEQLGETFKLPTQLATDDDIEWAYLRRVTLTAKPKAVPNNTYLPPDEALPRIDEMKREMAALLAASGDKRADIERLVRHWSERLGVADVRRLPEYNPRVTFDIGPIDNSANEAQPTGLLGRIGSIFRGPQAVAPPSGPPTGWGHGRWFRFDLTDDDLKGLALYRHTANNTNAAFFEKALTNQTPLITSAVDRLRDGAWKRAWGGMSPIDDITTGGARRTFSRIGRVHPSGYLLGVSDSDTVQVFHPRLLRDVDAVSYGRDVYGARDLWWAQHGGDIDTLKKHAKAHSNEILHPNGVPFRYLRRVMVKDAQERATVIRLFNESGVTPIEGSWEDIVQVKP